MLHADVTVHRLVANATSKQTSHGKWPSFPLYAASVDSSAPSTLNASYAWHGQKSFSRVFWLHLASICTT